MNIVAVTSCPTGVAHTYIAAQALEKAFKASGHSIKVETQGAIGIGNKLTSDEISNADFIILTNDVTIEFKNRFEGMEIVKVSVSDIIRKTNLLVKKLDQIYNVRNKK